MAIFMAAVEGTIVATAMPTIVAELGGFSLFSWIFTAYFLAQAVTTPIYGRLSDLFGRKRVFFVGACIFLIGSTACGLTYSMVPLIAFRTLQGVGAGAIQSIPPRSSATSMRRPTGRGCRAGCRACGAWRR
jgi:MFS family permease